METGVRIKWSRSKGFTLVEILIVVVILGILAGIVIAGFSNTSTEAKESMLKENLRIMRTQIGAYRAQHEDVSPGYPDGDERVVWCMYVYCCNCMCQSTIILLTCAAVYMCSCVPQ